MKIVKRRASAKVDGGLDFILSDATPDRLGDIIDPKGWDFESFQKNPIALFNHRMGDPIGRWIDVRVEKDALRGRLEFAKAGTSARIDELRALTEQGILRAVSVGFKPIEYETFKNGDDTGIHFKRQELLETSLVSVPANPNALHVARSISAATRELIFGKHAEEDQAERLRLIGKHAAIPLLRASPMTLQQHIEGAQARLVALKDKLTEHLAACDDNNVTDEWLIARDELNKQIDLAQRHHDGLKVSEQRLATASQIVVVKPSTPPTTHAPIAATAAKQLRPYEHTMRAVVGMIVGRATGKLPEQVIAEHYGTEDGKVDERSIMLLRTLQRADGFQVRDVLREIIVTRAATAPADTTTTAWAGALVQTDIAAFMNLLMPASVFPSLSARGLSISLGRNGSVSIPTRAATPTLAGAFVAEGAAIPVKQAAFSSTPLGPKRMAVISTFTRQIAQHSTPAIEGLIRDIIREDTSAALDAVLLDATAATAIRPAGLRAGVTKWTATAGGGFAALVGDLKGMVGQLITSSNGNVRSPVWIMNPAEALSISVTQNAGGDFPFEQEINRNTFRGYPLIQSSTVPAKMVLLIDAADFVTVDGEAPQFDVSDQATLHMEDTTPLAIGTPGSPNTVAAPVRSLFQTDTLAVRMQMNVNWAMRRTGMVSWTETVTW